MKSVSGSCLCGSVQFQCKNSFNQFHFCHCEQCQKITGAAHAANLFTQNDNIEWLSGESSITRYNVPGRSITSAFCSQCGSPVPYLSGSGKSLVVPAGSLNDTPNIVPQDNLFWPERANWYEAGIQAIRFDGFPR